MTFKKTLIAALTIATVAGGVLASTSDAEAQRFRGGRGLGVGIASGLVLGGLLAAGAASAGPAYVVDDYGPRRVDLQERYNRFGEYRGTVRVCRTVY